jgi:hypothetical protein
MDDAAMNKYRLAADLILIFHACFIAFVVLGLVVIWIGIARRWEWTRNFYFRALHLLAIAFVVFQTCLRITCPLTDWENHLRIRAGEHPYEPAGFIPHWLHRLIFFTAPPWVFITTYALFGLAVAGTMLVWPPRWPWRKVAATPAPASHTPDTHPT